MNVWRLVTHHEDPEAAVRWTRREDRIAIGWGSAGDLRQYNSPEEIAKGILRAWPESHNYGPGSKQLWDFVHTMKVDDLVIISDGKSRVMVTQVVDDYEYTDLDDVPIQGGDYRNQRRVRLLSFNADSVWRLAGGLAPGYGVRWTLIRCKNSVTNAGLRLMF